MLGESRYATVGGVRVHYVVAGTGSPVLLLHGLGASVATWRDNIGPLSERFQVVALDLPGHGDSAKPDIDYEPEAMSRFVADFVEATGLGSPTVVGNSVGGALGLMMALQSPVIVSALVLVSSASLGREVSKYLRLASLPGIGGLMEGGGVRGTRFMMKKVFHDPKFVQEALLDELWRTRQLPGAKEAVGRVLRRTVGLRGVRSRYVLLDRLEMVQAPVMIVWGREDRVLPVDHAYCAAQALPGARLEVLEGCGHWPHMEKASTFNRLLVEFLSR